MPTDRTALEKALVGPAGEHYVLYQLLRRGLLAAPAPERTPAVDLLVLSPDGETITATVQVKARTRHQSPGWIMSRKAEDLTDRRLFYAFVDLAQEPPPTFVVPAAVVASALQGQHAAWMAVPSREGRPHKDSDVRRLMHTFRRDVPGCPPGWLDEWRERWELLGS